MCCETPHISEIFLIDQFFGRIVKIFFLVFKLEFEQISFTFSIISSRSAEFFLKVLISFTVGCAIVLSN